MLLNEKKRKRNIEERKALAKLSHKQFIYNIKTIKYK
jgi:hypothetical protein